MIWQEILFYLLIIVVCAILDRCVDYGEENSHSYNTNTVVIYKSLSYLSIIFTVFLFCARIKAKYSYREIDDISVYDRSLKEELDFESPAILTVFYQTLRKYE